MTQDFNKIVPKVVGVKRAGYALIKTNTTEKLEHNEVKFLSRIRKVSIAPIVGENELDSNDAVEEHGNGTIGYTVSFDASGIEPETEAEIYGHKIDSNGAIIEQDGDQPPELALVLELTMSEKHSKYTVLYCGSAKQPTEDAETKTKKGFVYANPTIEFTFGKALNGMLKYTLRTDSKTYKKETGEAWFNAVQYPVFSPAAAAKK